MTDPLRFLFSHPYGVLGLVVAAEQLGLPIPGVPVLLAVGALAGMDRLGLVPALLLAVSASLLSDLIWYEVGRRRGGSVLGLLCRLSLEPDSCVRRTEDTFTRYGARTLLFAKFVPGLNAVATPLAGVVGMKRHRFLAFDAAGAALWSGAYLALGYLFSDQLEAVAEVALRLGGGLVAMLVAALALYLAWKYAQRRRFLRSLRVARISPEELKQRLDGREDIVVVDLRHSLDFEADPHWIPGALHMTPDELEKRHDEIPRDRDVILYCT